MADRLAQDAVIEEGFAQTEPIADSTGGVNVALTQHFLDYAVSVAKPPIMNMTREPSCRLIAEPSIFAS